MKRLDSAANARTKKVAVMHAGESALRRIDLNLDLRTRAGKAHRAHVVALSAHVGPEPTVPQRSLIEQAARLRILAQIAWAELSSGGAFANGEPRAALDVYRRVAADERDVLKTLGLARKEKAIPTLEDYLNGQGDA